MKASRILLVGCELLKMMSICDLKIDDWKYLEMYSEYVKARNHNVKYSAIICGGSSGSTSLAKTIEANEVKEGVSE